ncbi:MAG: hypothetical protein JW737_05550 [Acidobacteria bacterium]|nr:hypothetical protein [Acidobacteriota bacterium]
MTKKFIIFSLALLLLAPTVILSAGKVRVAVMEFENNAASQWSSYGLGKAAQDALVTALVESGNFSVIERQKIDMLLAEQGFGESGRVTPQSAAKIGKLLGVQIIITGSVTQFGREETGGGIAGLVGGKVVEWSGALDARMINVDTGEIMDVAKGEGTITEGGARIKGVHLATSGGYNERAGEVMLEAVEDIVEQFSEKVENLKETMGSSAKVALVKDGKVYLNVGSNYGVEVGDIFVILSEGEAIIDPDTGLELDRETSVTGRLEVMEVKAKVSICRIVNGNANKGDLAKKK